MGIFEPRRTWILKESNQLTKQFALIDGLRGADAVEFGRTISGDHDEGHKRLRSLRDTSVQLRGGGPAGDHDRHRRARGERTPKGEEAGATFINTHVDA